MKIKRSHQFVMRFAALSSFLSIGLLFTLAVVTTGCGSSNSSSSSGTSTTPTPAAKTVVQVNMGDAPADWMLAFSMNISSMSLQSSSGNISVISSSMPIELMHLMGSMQPLTMISVPQGTYTGATVTISSAIVTYMDPVSGTMMQKTMTGPITGSISFGSSIVVGSTPMALGFDLDLGQSVTADTNGNLSFLPVFHVTSGLQGAGNPQDFSGGGIHEMIGMVSAVSGTTFTMTSMQAAQSFTFSTNASTEFDNLTGMSMMSSGMMVAVDSVMQSDGSLLVTKVASLMSSNGAMAGGIISSTTGIPATQMVLVMQHGEGSGMMSSSLSAEVTVNLNDSTVYRIDQDNVDLSGLPFTPAFDASHIYVGQGAMPISSTGMMNGGSGGMMGSGMMSGTLTATEVQLEQQGMSGTIATSVTSGSRSNFSLTLSAGSAFTTLSGASTITVYQQSGTVLSGTLPLSSGAKVHVYGLLFFDAGQWKMVASRITGV